MTSLRVCLFGRFHTRVDDRDLTDLFTHRMQELFSYLLLYRDRQLSREALAELLCGNCSTAQSKKSLRQTLWHIQTIMDAHIDASAGQLLATDVDWVQLHSEPLLWLDIAAFEKAFAFIQGLPAEGLDDTSVRMLHDSVELYQGELLEGWYQDWCLNERERLQNMFLIILDKLMVLSEVNHQYEAGLFYGMKVLQRDRARERTHRQLMRLYYLAGDRTGALRQYERCVAALYEELGVKPSRSTVALYDVIRADQSILREFSSGPLEPTIQSPNTQLDVVLSHLKDMQADLVTMQLDVQTHIRAVELLLHQ
jgi:DNA-binding SARP family transcriptional activator